MARPEAPPLGLPMSEPAVSVAVLGKSERRGLRRRHLWQRGVPGPIWPEPVSTRDARPSGQPLPAAVTARTTSTSTSTPTPSSQRASKSPSAARNLAMASPTSTHLRQMPPPLRMHRRRGGRTIQVSRHEDHLAEARAQTKDPRWAGDDHERYHVVLFWLVRHARTAPRPHWGRWQGHRSVLRLDAEQRDQWSPVGDDRQL